MLDLPASGDPSDVLAQRTRARLFALLADLKRPAVTAELAGLLKLHPNGVRAHLERLVDAGLVDRARVPAGPGRPADSWTIAAEARPGGVPPQAYRDLGRWLARALQTPAEHIEDIGREIGRELAPADAVDPAGTLEATIAALGFQPFVTRDDTTVTICLRNCPYSDAVRENPAAVCGLHKGITCGLLDVVAPNASLAAFVPLAPEQAGCLIELHGLDERASHDEPRR